MDENILITEALSGYSGKLPRVKKLKKICTIGYTKKSAKVFFQLLKNGGVTLLVDIRRDAGYGVTGFTFPRDLEYFCELHGIKYVVRKELAPTDEIRSLYKKTNDWSQYVVMFIEYFKETKPFLKEEVRKVFYGDDEVICLLCTEHSPEKCHRNLVAKMFLKVVGNREQITVEHLPVGVYNAKGGE